MCSSCIIVMSMCHKEETNLYWRNKEINPGQNMDANVRKVKVLSRGEIDEMVFRHLGLAHLQVSRLCPANMCPKIPKCVRRKEGISRNLVSSSFFEKNTSFSVRIAGVKFPSIVFNAWQECTKRDEMCYKTSALNLSYFKQCKCDCCGLKHRNFKWDEKLKANVNFSKMCNNWNGIP